MPRPLQEATPSLGKQQTQGVLESRLRDLQSLWQKQLITEQEYCSKKQQLLESLTIFSPPETTVRPNDLVTQGSFQEDPASSDTLMRYGFGLLVSPHTRQKRAEKIYEIGGQAPVRQESLHTLRDRFTVDVSEQRYKFYCSLINTHEAPPVAARSNPPKIHHDKRFKTMRSFGDGAKKKKEKPLQAYSMADLQVYDITAGRVQELFYGERDDLIDGDQMDANGLVRRLGKLDLAVSHESAKLVIQKVQWAGGSTGESNQINVEEFDLMLTSLRLAELFTANAGVFRFREDGQDRFKNPISLCDYCATTHCLEKFSNVEELKPLESESDSPTVDVRCFLFDVQREVQLLQQVKAREQVRWVHVDASEKGLDQLTVLRLATKYHLHPLAVEDVIDNKTPPKVDDFEDHYFVSMDVISLLKHQGEDDDDDNEQVQSGEHRVQTLRSNASIFISKAPVCDTLLSIFQNRPDETSWLAMWRGKGKAAEKEQPVPDGTLWNKLREDLTKDPKKGAPMRVREQKADFLLYEILHRIVNELQPITEAYSQRLGYMHQRDPWTWSAGWLEELSDVNLELTDIARSIRPMRQVVHYFIHERRIGRVAQTYLEDTEDQINQILDDLSQLQEMIVTLTHAHEESQDKRMNLMLFILSIVSAIFLPAQFVTGLYGMNFEGLMPELEWTEPISGYAYFWILQLAILMFSVCMLCCLHNCSRRTAGMEDCCSRMKKKKKTFRTLCSRKQDEPVRESESDLF